MKADLESIVVYFLSLALTLLFLTVLKKKRSFSQSAKCFMMVVSCLPLSILAGARVGVGTDYYSYVRIFSIIKQQSLISNFTNPDQEIGFTIIVKLLSMISSSDAFIFGTLEFITLLFVVMALYKERSNMDMVGSFAIYYLLFYHSSYNIIRQCLAIAILLYAITFFVRKQIGHYVLWVIIASLMHLTALMGVLFLLALPMLGQRPDFLRPANRSLRIWSLVYWVVVISGAFLFPVILKMLLKLPFLSVYRVYAVHTDQWGIGTILIFILHILPVFFFGSTSDTDNVNVYFHLYSLYVPISQLGYYATWASRLNLYPLVCLIPMVGAYIRQKRRPIKSFCVAYYSILMIITYMNDILIRNFHGTFPYVGK